VQSILNGFQHEQPDYWLTFGNPWEIERLIVSAWEQGQSGLSCTLGKHGEGYPVGTAGIAGCAAGKGVSIPGSGQQLPGLHKAGIIATKSLATHLD
jgi:starch phosphorylase